MKIEKPHPNLNRTACIDPIISTLVIVYMVQPKKVKPSFPRFLLYPSHEILRINRNFVIQFILSQNNFYIVMFRENVTASSYRSLNALTEVEEPAGMGESLGTGAHRHRSILPPGVKYVAGPRVLRRILSNRS